MERFLYNPADRFTSLIEEICYVLARHASARFIEAPLLVLIWNRVIRLSRRFARIVERAYAGTRADPAPRRRAATPRPPRPSRGAPSAVLPQHFRWLVHLIPETERFAADLCFLLRQPEFVGLIAEVPQAGRILRPLCRMLGVEPPPALMLPPRLYAETIVPEPDPPPEQAWRDPAPPWRSETQFWKFHPRNRGDPPNRD